MMAGIICRRLFHTSRLSFTSGDKSLLATLRQKTGYTFSNCKKALVLHNNDISKAEDWLHSQAKAEGWAKIGKLQSRITKEGLVGIAYSNNVATMIEVNCETDFVARNENFRSLVSSVALSSLKYATDSGLQAHDFRKISLGKTDLSNLKTDEEHKVADLIAWHVNMLGENISLGRAVCLSVENDMQISGYTHPPNLHQNHVMMGKFGSIVCYKKLPEPALCQGVTLSDIGRLLAKQIVGMNPETIGKKEDGKKKEETEKVETKEKESDEEEQKEEETLCDNVETETRLIFQSIIDEPDMTIGEFIDQNGVQVIDYTRFQCGETY